MIRGLDSGTLRLLLAFCLLALVTLPLLQLAAEQQRRAEQARRERQARLEAERLRALEDRVLFHPSDAAARDALVRAYLMAGRARDAAAIRERPDHRSTAPGSALLEGSAVLGTTDALQSLLDRAEKEPGNLALQRQVVARCQAANRLRAAIPALERLARANRSDTATLRRLGIARLQAGQDRAARDHLKAVVARDPNDAVALFYLGLAHAGRAEVEEALAAFRRVRRLRPDYAPAALEEIRLLIEEWRLDEAAGAARQLVKRRPRLADGHYQLGVALHYLRDFAGAEAALREATRLDPHRARYHGWLGLALLEQNRAAEATAAFEAAVAANPHYTNALYQLGRVHLMEGRLDAAEEALRRVLLLDPRHAEACYSFSQLLLRQGRRDEARRIQARVRALNAFEQRRQELETRARAQPDRPEWRRRLGDLFAREGLHREAQAQYERAKELGG